MIQIQRMSAGRGITHSEFNASQSQMCHFLQIWIMPGSLLIIWISNSDNLGRNPSYQQKSFDTKDLVGKRKLLCSRDGRDNSISLDHDADIYASVVDKEVKHFIPHVLKSFW